MGKPIEKIEPRIASRILKGNHRHGVRHELADSLRAAAHRQRDRDPDAGQQLLSVRRIASFAAEISPTCITANAGLRH